jgi:large subunit ribosomal protein L3
VTQIKTVANEGYPAIQIGYGVAKDKHLSRPEIGHFEKNGITQRFRHLREFRVPDVSSYQVGQVVQPDFLTDIDKVSVTGRSIGKGFQGRIRLHNFSRGPMSHGSKSHRLPGSIGAGTTPGRVFKGLKMAAHMGDNTVTTDNLKVMRADLENRLLLLKGTVPGKPGSIVLIRPRNAVGRKKV